MAELAVVCWSSDEYAVWADGLHTDAKRLGYAFHHYRSGNAYQDAVDASLNHPRFALQAVRQFGKVLFCDAECRILKPIPDWPAPSIAVRNPKVPFHLYYNSGTMLLDRGCIDWLQDWIRVIERFQLGLIDSTQYYLRHPGDVCDELALHSALAVRDIHPHELRLECIDRSAPSEIARGYWSNSHTVIQHPTLQHWPAAQSEIRAKKLFLQNYPGDTDIASTTFRLGTKRLETDGWFFDGPTRTYAPLLYPDHPKRWTDENVELTAEEL